MDRRHRWNGPLLALCMLSCGVLCAEDFKRHNYPWELELDAVFLRRNHVHDRPVVKDNNKVRQCDDCGNFTVISSESVAKHFDFNPGARGVLTYREDVKNSFEAVFLWVQPWGAHKAVSGDDSLFYPFHNPTYAFDYFNASKASAEYDSRFWDLELNYWRHFSPRNTDYFSISGLAGFRYFHLNESFKVVFHKPPDTSHYSAHTENDVFGAQLGFDLQVTPTSRIGWDFIGKVGVMANRAKQNNFLLDHNDTVTLRRFREQKWQCGLFADALIQAGYQFKKPFNLHVGYEFIALSGLALAPDQLDRGSGTGAGKNVDVDDYVIIQGFFMGATFGF